MMYISIYILISVGTYIYIYIYVGMCIYIYICVYIYTYIISCEMSACDDDKGVLFCLIYNSDVKWPNIQYVQHGQWWI
jgi:hypothetical protein